MQDSVTDPTLRKDQSKELASKKKEIKNILSLKLFSMFSKKQMQRDRKQVYQQFLEDIIKMDQHLFKDVVV